ncbi:hypothetical protein [Bradyrhizobium sp. Ec3.3]|uniref:hypothetical protein n=1 Tax=Bradyrhizobium sp. Ec3.3 TaxID=189753 RepID=UPI0012EB51BE|nr:hypothetical protein [Bradyrhizobium sp. Ec3.3]
MNRRIHSEHGRGRYFFVLLVAASVAVLSCDRCNALLIEPGVTCWRYLAIDVSVVAISIACILVGIPGAGATCPESRPVVETMEDKVMLVIYLPIIIFEAMLEVMAKQNVSATTTKPVSFD